MSEIDIENPSFVNPLMYLDFGDEIQFTTDKDAPTTFIRRHNIDITACEVGEDIHDALHSEAEAIAKMYEDDGFLKPEYQDEFYYLNDLGGFGSDVESNYIELLQLAVTQLHEETQTLALRARVRVGKNGGTYGNPDYTFAQGMSVDSFLAWYFGDDSALEKPTSDSQLDTWVTDLSKTRHFWPPTMQPAFMHFLGCLKSRLHDYEYPKYYRRVGGDEKDLAPAKELAGPFGVF